VIAEDGFAKASFSRIAKHAGLSSTGMISYHFAGLATAMEVALHGLPEKKSSPGSVS
jgi:AcrR family transcriptional regulator